MDMNKQDVGLIAFALIIVASAIRSLVFLGRESIFSFLMLGGAIALVATVLWDSDREAPISRHVLTVLAVFVGGAAAIFF